MMAHYINSYGCALTYDGYAHSKCETCIVSAWRVTYKRRQRALLRRPFDFWSHIGPMSDEVSQGSDKCVDLS